MEKFNGLFWVFLFSMAWVSLGVGKKQTDEVQSKTALMGTFKHNQEC